MAHLSGISCEKCVHKSSIAEFEEEHAENHYKDVVSILQNWNYEIDLYKGTKFCWQVGDGICLPVFPIVRFLLPDVSKPAQRPTSSMPPVIMKE